MAWWIIICWFLAGGVARWWHQIWGKNRFGAYAFNGPWWMLFNLFILGGPCYLLAWTIAAVWWTITDGVSLLGNDEN